MQKAYDQAKGVTNPNNKYTADSWSALQTALTAAQKVLTNTDATSADIDTALKNLKAAYTGLKPSPTTKPDKSKLQAAYDKDKAVTNTDNKYTADSWKTFQTAVSAAQNVLANNDATQSDVDTALQKLNDAYNGLTPTNGEKADKKALQTAYDKDKAVTNTDNKYTADSWKTFQTALENAQNVLADNKAVQTDVDAALQKLNDAYDGLTVNPDTKPDKSALQTAVNAAQALSDAAVTGDHEGNYPADAVTTFKNAITAAKKVLTDASATKDDVTNAVSTLNQTVATFKKAAITVNRDPLTQLVKASQALKEADYTSDSWTTFQQAFSAAQKLLAGKPSQQELDAAVTALQAAKNNLATAGQLPSTGGRGSGSSSSSQAPSASSSAAPSSSSATDQTTPASESSSSSNKNKYPNTGESQLSLAVTVAALALLAGIGGLAWFLHEKGKMKQE
ncbi:hypothetical protein [Lacticaseibacillus chiayiensis]|uniref:hypothetical protein n=1 Tax=Lacticaseibacillus chiayiensis TaxID=2100821 RepID=UPI001EDF6207|nr:hypothetical protein [Lacticaseibacillus chiayiensis]